MLTSTVLGLQIVDLAAIALYFSVIIVIGYRAMRRIKTQEDYFLGGRRFGKVIQTFAAFGQATSADNAVGMTTVVNTNGAAGIWSSLAGGLFCVPLFWMTSVWFRRMRYLTLADFFEERYGSKAMAGFYALCQGVFFMFAASLGFVAMGKTVAAIAVKPVAELNVMEAAEHRLALRLDGLEAADFASLDPAQQEQLQDLRLQNPRKEFSYINETVLILTVALIVLVYAVLGGLEAAFVTDMIQSIFIILLSLMLIPFAMMRINQENGASGIYGTFQALHQKLPESFFELWGSPKVIEFTWYWILTFAVVGVFNVVVQANQLTACGSARDEYTARFGFVTGIFLKRYCTVIWGFVALMTVVLYGGTIKNPDYVWGHATRDLLGHFGVGLVGLMIACLMAGLMSTVDCLMITASSLLTNNVYRPLVPDRPESHYVWAGRILGAVYMIGCVIISSQFRTVFALIKFNVMFLSILAASFWLGMLWRRANRIGAWSSMVITLIFTIVLPLLIPMFPNVRTHPYLLKTTNPEPIIRVYSAREMDVIERQERSMEWDRKHAMGQADGERPELLTLNQKFEKTFVLPKKSVFWQEGFEFATGEARGVGMLKVELVALDYLGFDLSRNSYSLNETIVALFRIVVPFGVLILVSLVSRPDARARLDRFFVKMKTPVLVDREADARALALAYENPRDYDQQKLFPNSNWEFRKWERADLVGFLICIAGVAGCILFMVAIVRIGG